MPDDDTTNPSTAVLVAIVLTAIVVVLLAVGAAAWLVVDARRPCDGLVTDEAACWRQYAPPPDLTLPDPVQEDDAAGVPEASISKRETPPPETSACEALLDSAPLVAAGDHEALPPPWEIVIEDEDDPALVEEYGFAPQGIYDPDGYELRVFPSAEDETFVALHELGHVVDDRCFGVADRNAWMQEHGLTPPWVDEDDPYSSPDEHFADSFAVCLSGQSEFWTVEGTPPSEQDCRTLWSLLVAGRNGG